MKTWNKTRIILAFIFTAIYLFTFLSPVCGAATKEFPDTSGHWAQMYLSRLVEKGAISGMPDGNFYPDDTITVSQFIKIIISSEFGDIAPIGNHWASGYIQKAIDFVLIDVHEFSDEAIFDLPVTRMQAAKIVTHTLSNILGEDLESNTSAVDRFLDYIAGCKICMGEFHSYVGQPYVKGIISGKPGPVFDGDASLTRAEASVIIMRMFDPQLRTPLVTE